MYFPNTTDFWNPEFERALLNRVNPVARVDAHFSKIHRNAFQGDEARRGEARQGEARRTRAWTS